MAVATAARGAADAQAPAWLPRHAGWLGHDLPADELEPCFRANFAARSGLIDRLIPYHWAWSRVRRGLRRAQSGDPAVRVAIDRHALVIVKRPRPGRWYLYGAISLRGVGDATALRGVAGLLERAAREEGVTRIEILVMNLRMARHYRRAYGFRWTWRPWVMRRDLLPRRIPRYPSRPSPGTKRPTRAA